MSTLTIEDDASFPAFVPGDVVDCADRPIDLATLPDCRVVALLRDGRLCAGVATDGAVTAAGEIVRDVLAAWPVTAIRCRQ